VILEIKDCKISDNGVYTCKAVNDWGEDSIDLVLKCGPTGHKVVVKPKFTTQLKVGCSVVWVVRPSVCVHRISKLK